MTKKDLTLIIAAGVVLIVGVGYAMWHVKNKAIADANLPTFVTGTPIIDEGSDEMAVSAIIGQGMETVKTETGTTITVATKDYGAAVGVYGKSGYRFQFSNCSGNPGTLTMKVGTKFMIDNRDNISHKISIGTKSYQLAAYDYAIVTIQKVGKFNITCDGGGSASVWVQK